MMGQLCSCHSGKANHRKDFTSSWSNLLSRRPTLSSWRRKRLKSEEFLGYDNLPFDPVPSKTFHLVNRCEKHLSSVTLSVPDRNGVGEAETDDVSDAERNGEPEQDLTSDAARDLLLERALCRASLWRNTAQETRLRRVTTHQWQRSNGGVRSLNLPGEPIKPPLARFLRKKRANYQLPSPGDPWSCSRLIEGAKEWLCGQLDPWALFQALQGLHDRVDSGLLALELGRCITRTDSCRCLLDYATSPTAGESDGEQPLSFVRVREALNAAQDHRLERISEFLEVIDAIIELSLSIGRSQSTSPDEERTFDNPEQSLSSTPGDPLNGPPIENPLSEEPSVPPTDFRRSNKDESFRCEIIHHSQERPCLYATCVSVDRGSTPVHRDQSFTRRRHSALCHPDDDPQSFRSSLPQPELPSLSISIFSLDLSAECVRKLTRILVDYAHVTSLSIVRAGLGDCEGFGELCHAFDRSSRGIEHFDFRMNSLLEGNHIGYLSNALRTATSLRSINLSSTGLTAEACRCLVEAIGTGSAANRVLAELDLGYNELSDEGCSAVAELIEMPGCWLRKLRLRHNGVGPSGAKRLAAALLTHPRLTLLDVSSNPVGDVGVLSLAESLLGNRTLRDVAVDDCGVTGEGCKGVARMLMTNSVLRSLTLSRNSLGDEGVRTLAEGVRHNRTLEVLGIDMCCLGNAGFICLLQELRLCHSMRVLRACYNAIGMADHMTTGSRRWSSASVRIDAALAPTGSDPHLLDVYVQLCEVLRQNPKLKIFLWGNRLDEDDDDVTSASAFKPEAGDPEAKWRRSHSAVDSGYGTLSSEKTSAAFLSSMADKVVNLG